MRDFLHQLIDYAGLFPPAKLPLPEAIRLYASYRSHPDAWMLGGFICPASQLKDLAPYDQSLFTHNPPFRFIVLGRGGKTPVEFIDGFEQDVHDIAAFRKHHGPRVAVTGFETRLPTPPPPYPGEPDNLLSLFDTMMEEFDDSDRATLPVFLESPPTDATHVASALAAHNQKNNLHWGYKLRCGGVEASAFPPVEHIADAILACRDAAPSGASGASGASGGVAMKCTAGLHHPVRHYRDEVKTKMHGFVNVFVGGILASVHNLSTDQLQQIIADEEPAHFRLTAQAVAWNNLTATAAQVEKARRGRMVSYGSCSFDEPRDDLRQLHWL